jgi:ATP-dependent Lhr-like helicase
MVFELLNPELQKIVAKRFKEPTLPQKLAFKPILEGKNVLIIAPTGLGKTEGVMLPLFHLVMQEKPKPIAILYVTPLRALNRDLLDRLLWWCNEIGIEASVRHGDTSAYERKQQAEFPPLLLITTPETLQAMLPGKILREHLKNVKWLVIDEIHELVDSKRGTQLSLALERLKELIGHDFQVIGLSATVGSPEKVAKFLCPNGNIEVIKAVQPKAMQIKVVSPKPEVADSRIAKKLFVSEETASRLRLIMELIKSHRSTLTFTNTREFAEILASRIKALNKDFPIAVHHSSLSKEVRIKAEKEFKEEKIKSIISTSSLQLGIDIGSVDLVLQYMSPRTVTQAIQRIGRSGHGVERISKGIIITTDEDDIFESAVIARKALNEEIESLKLPENSYDVLAHQLVGLTLDNWKVELQKAYEIVKKAYPYQKLSFTEFLEVCKQLQQLGLIFLNGQIKKKRRGFEYYFNQLSTIPDTKQFKVFNSLDNSFVGVLDEEFVALNAEPGLTFILKGEAYKIISIEEDKILVEPVEDIEAAIPGWEGELIPVPFEVAQEVGRLRRILLKSLEEKSEEEIVEWLLSSYPIDENCAKAMVKTIKKQKKYGIVPDDKTILIEDYENSVIIHACFGSLVNETLGRFLSSLLIARIGSVGLKTDPYRIILHFQVKALELLKEILFNTKPEHLRSYIEMYLSKSNLFEWKFVHVAKRFGAIARDADYSKVRLSKIVESYVGTPIFKETLKELETEKLDVEKATEILRRIQNGEIKVVFKEGLSPLGKIGLKHEFAELVGPTKPELEIFELFKKRLMNTSIKLVCVNCGQWQQSFVVKEIPENVRCKKCEARLLGIVHPKNMEAIKIVKKKIRGTITEGEKGKFERIRKSADLFLVYGKKAAIALAARGIGPETAKRILAKYHKDEDDFLRDILEAEKLYLRTKRYWKI